MTNLKNFLKLAVIACCLLIPSFSSTQVVSGQKEQLPEKQRGATDDYVIIEGDIQVSPSFYQELQASAHSPQAAPIKYPTKLWPNGIVPFEFDSKRFSVENQARMIDCDGRFERRSPTWTSANATITIAAATTSTFENST